MGRGVSAAGISFADDKLHVGGGNGPAAEAAGKSAGRKEPGTGEKKALPPDDRRRSQCGEIFSDQPSDWKKKHPDLGKQWLSLPGNMQLLVTPGILWPKFEDPEVGLNLAFCGSIKDEILDVASLALELISLLQRDYPELLAQRYKLEELSQTPLETMEAAARKRGCILPGKKIDYERIARVVLDEFRSGKIGKITLEKVK